MNKKMARQLSRSTPTTPVKSEAAVAAAGSGPATSNTPSAGKDSEEKHRGIYVKNPRLKLPTTPVETSTPSKSSTPVNRPNQLMIQLNTIENEIIRKCYDDRSAVNQAVNDVNQLMTSSCHVAVATPTTSGSDVFSTCDSGPVSSPGSNTASMTSSVASGSGSDEVDMVDGRGTWPSLADSAGRPSFRRAELVPTVRRFIAKCLQLSEVVTDAERAAEFNTVLTDGVHAFIAVMAVSRRATYGERKCNQLSEALQLVAESYCDMLTSAGSAVGLPADHSAVIAASKKAASFAGQLSSLLITVKNLKANKNVSYFAFF